MSGTARLHFIYIVSILIAIIVCLISARVAENAQVVSYVSFALTLASILLAVVATVYAFVSNASLAQSIGGLHQATSDVRVSAVSLDRLASGLDQKFGTFAERVEATHDLVRSMSNPVPMETPPQGGGTGSARPVADFSELVERSSKSGQAAMYAAAVAYRTGRSFNRAKLFELLGKGNDDYYWGWLLALDAMGILDISQGADDTWSVVAYPEDLLDNILRVAADLEEGSPHSHPTTWNGRKVAAIDAYFAQAAT